VARLTHILRHGVKEGLVDRPQHWPGVHCAQALLAGTDLEGKWFDRTAEYEARRRGETIAAGRFATPERVVFSPLPCWSALDAAVYRERVRTLIDSLVAEGRRARNGRPVLGKKAILDQHPHDKPLHSDRSPAPAVHAASKEIWILLRVAYWEFVAAFREAAHRLRCGDQLVRFPPGAFPPAMPCALPTY
jgi:hypothetical protein